MEERKHFLVVLFLIVVTLFNLFTFNELKAQWVQANGPIGGNISCIASNGSDLFAGTNGGIFKFPQNGTKWISINNGLTILDVRGFAFIGSSIFAALYQSASYPGGVCVSNDGGNSWLPANNGLTNKYILTLNSINNNLYAGATSGKMYLSSNNGTSWTLINSGLPSAYSINSITFKGDFIFIGTYGDGVYKSSNNGLNWIRSNSGIGSSALYVNSIASNSSLLIIGTNAGVYRSNDNGLSWTAANSGITSYAINSVYASGSITSIYACTHGSGVFISTNNGGNWTNLNTGLTNLFVNPLLLINSNLYIGSYGDGIFTSQYGSNSWMPFNSGLVNSAVNTLSNINGKLFTGTFSSGVFTSADNGASWLLSNSGITNKTSLSFAWDGTNIYCGTYGTGVFKSVDGGNHWIALGTTGLTNKAVYSLLLKDGKIFAGTYSGVCLSSDGGISWNPINSGMPTPLPSVRDLVLKQNTVFAALTGSGVYFTNDDGVSWNSANNGFPVNKSVNVITLCEGTLFAGGYGIYYSTDNGSSWIADTIGLTNKSIGSLISYDNVIYAGSNGDGVFAQKGSGSTWSDWTAIKTGLNKLSDVRDLTVNGKYLYCGTYGNGVWKTMKLNNSPQLISPVNNSENTLTSLNVQWAKVIDDNEVNFSNKYWFELSTDLNFTNSLIDTTLTDTLKTLSGLENDKKYYWKIKSKNHISWGWQAFSATWCFTTFSTPQQKLQKLIITIDSLKTAGIINEGNANSLITKLKGAIEKINKGDFKVAINKLDAFINEVEAMIKSGRLTQAQGQLLIDVANAVIEQLNGDKAPLIAEIPKEFKVFQNYPNPFNPTTNIRFQIKDAKFVTLIVYNILGKEVARLVDGKLNPGIYNVTFDGSSLASGIYIYKLTTNDYSEVKKMFLIK